MSTTLDTDQPSRRGQATGTQRLSVAAVYLVGALLYYAARERFGLSFMLSPFVYGLILLVASIFRQRLLASAALLLIWGLAVELDGRGPLAAGRTAALYMTAFGLGAGVLLLLRRWVDAQVALESVALVMLTAGIWFYLSYDYPTLIQPWLWSAWFIVSGLALVAAEVAARWRDRRRT